MRLGLLLSGGSRGDGSDLVDATLSMARAARDAGFGVVVAGQHFLTAPLTYLQPVPLLARLIPETGQMNLATGVLLLPLLHPVQVAEDLASLDALSGGRLIVGVGQGYRDVEFDVFGVARQDRLTRQLETLEIMKRLWTGKGVSHDGTHYRVVTDGVAMRPLQAPHPPIWYAASSEKTVKRAIHEEYVPYLGPQVARSVVAELLACGDAPPAGVALRRDVLVRGVVDDETIRRCVAARDARYESWGYRSTDGDSGLDDRTGREGPYLVGSVEECTERLHDYGSLGVTTVVLRSTWDGLPIEASVEMIEAFSDVTARLRGTT